MRKILFISIFAVFTSFCAFSSLSFLSVFYENNTYAGHDNLGYFIYPSLVILVLSIFLGGFTGHAIDKKIKRTCDQKNKARTFFIITNSIFVFFSLSITITGIFSDWHAKYYENIDNISIRQWLTVAMITFTTVLGGYAGHRLNQWIHKA